MGTAPAYTATGQLDDANTASTSTGDVTGTRYYTFAGATVAVRTATGLSLMFGDEQGSTSVVMPVTVQTDGTLASATLADAAAVTRTSYTPFGELRGADNAALDRGWLGQVEDRVVGTGASSTGTGLTYLNARYYDPATMRFISPDPLINPADPETLDPYRYADNNPVVFTDATGLATKGTLIDGESGTKNAQKKQKAAAKQTNTTAAIQKAQQTYVMATGVGSRPSNPFGGASQGGNPGSQLMGGTLNLFDGAIALDGARTGYGASVDNLLVPGTTRYDKMPKPGGTANWLDKFRYRTRTLGGGETGAIAASRSNAIAAKSAIAVKGAGWGMTGLTALWLYKDSKAMYEGTMSDEDATNFAILRTLTIVGGSLGGGAGGAVAGTAICGPFAEVCAPLGAFAGGWLAGDQTAKQFDESMADDVAAIQRAYFWTNTVVQYPGGGGQCLAVPLE